MPKFFADQSKPDPQKNAVQNYRDHITFLEKEFQKTFPQDKIASMAKEDPAKLLSKITDEALKHLLMFDALRDGYDYADEVAGATIIPLLCNVVSLGLAANGIWEGIQAMAIKLGLQEDDHENHAEQAVSNLFLAGAAFAFSLACFIKSVVSLVTRPLVTCINGYKPQDTDRFTVDDSIVGSLSS